LTENDGHENDGLSKLQDMKLTDQVAGHDSAGREFAGHKNARHEIAGHENAGREIAGQKNIHCESKKTNRHKTLAYSFPKYSPIFKILSLLDSLVTLQQTHI